MIATLAPFDPVLTGRQAADTVAGVVGDCREFAAALNEAVKNSKG